MKFKNISIKRRILFSNISMILVPILIILIISPFFMNIVEKAFMAQDMSASSYNTVSQFQLNLIQSEINNELNKNDFEGNKYILSKFEELEKNGTEVILYCNGDVAYSSKSGAKVISEKASKIFAGDKLEESAMSVTQDGFASIANINSANSSYRLLMYNGNFFIDNAESTKSTFETMKYFTLRFALIILMVIGIFVMTIVAISFITTSGIIKPIHQLKKAANEISNGNLDYEMEYDSTNEFGVLVNDFDQMRLKLKNSINKQEQLEQQRKEMIAGFSHDLRTPLTSIKGYVEGLLDGIANTPEKENTYLKTIYNTANDMENMVSELFLFSKLDVDKVTLEKENVAIVNYLEDFCDEQSFELEKSNIDICFVAECNRMTAVSIDRNKFARVLLNIISNSVKYRRPDVKGKIDIDVSKNEKYAIIKVKDNGIGIDNESVKHIFETFYRADPARTNVREGSGIGLSICKQIIDLHDGNIWATGEIDGGMTITIALPLPDMK